MQENQENENQAIGNNEYVKVEIPKVEFKSLDEINHFVGMTKTDTADFFFRQVKQSIKIIGKEQDVYYYNENIKLWKCVTKEVYECSVADHFNALGKQLWRSFKKFVSLSMDDNEDDDDEEIGKLRFKVQTKQKELDSTAYLKTIVDRSTGKLQDNHFAAKLNVNPDYLPIKNGKKVSLITGEVSDRTKLDLFTFECDVDVIDKTPKADLFFSQIMPNRENREYLRKVLGYCLTGNMDGRCFFIWYGDGSNGKSVIFKLLKAILKPLYHQTSKGIFMKGSQEKVEGPSPDKIALMGVRVAAYSEGETSDDIDINESFLKMVSGKDEINARALFRAPLTFFPVCKLNLLTNYKPDLNGDKSIRQRIRYMFLDSSFVDNPDKTRTNEFKRDDDFIEDLSTIYLSEIFSWILKGSIEYYKNKEIKPTNEFSERTNAFFEQQDSITSFFNIKLQITGDKKKVIKKSNIVELYQKHCNDNSLRCQKRSTLFKRLDDLKIQTSTLNGYEVYRGVQIREYNPIDEEEDNSMFAPVIDKAVTIRAEDHKREIDQLKAEHQKEIANMRISKLEKIEKQFNDICNKLDKYFESRQIKQMDTLDILNS